MYVADFIFFKGHIFFIEILFLVILFVLENHRSTVKTLCVSMTKHTAASHYIFKSVNEWKRVREKDNLWLRISSRQLKSWFRDKERKWACWHVGDSLEKFKENFSGEIFNWIRGRIWCKIVVELKMILKLMKKLGSNPRI